MPTGGRFHCRWGVTLNADRGSLCVPDYNGNSISGAFGWKILYIDKNILKVECTFPGIEGVLTYKKRVHS